MSTAARLAEHLHSITAVATSDTAPVADVSTTVAVLLDRTDSSSPGEGEPVASATPGTYVPTVPATFAPAQPVASTARSAPLCLDAARRVALLAGSTLALTRREYDLLLFLAGHPGRVFTRPQLLRWVWGQDIISGERTVDVHVRRLRRKLRQEGPTITTVRGIGYRLDDACRVEVIG
jgi:DNA-binding response OmpR family regulator